MVKRILKFLYSETGTLHKAAYLLGIFALLSQVLAFVRDRLLAHEFGAGALLDTYYAAFRIPDFLFVTVASVVSISVLVPFVIEREKQGSDAVKRFVDNIFSFFSFLILGVSLVAFFLIPALAPVLFKGFSGEALERVVMLSRLLLLSPIFLGFSNLLGSLTQAYNRFTIYAFAPLLYNAGIILGTLFLAPRFGIFGVAIGVVVGSFMHMIIQVPFVVQLGLFPRLRRRLEFTSIRDVALLSFPRTLSLSVSHVASLFLVSLASLMAAGSITVFSFAQNLQSVPLSIIGVSYSLAAFPTLSRHFAANNMEAFLEQMATTARHIIFWSLPATVLFIMLREQIVRVLLGSGEFNPDDIRLTAAALAIFSISVLAQSLLLLFTRGFYSAGYTKKPFLINLFSAGAIAGLAYGLVKLFYAWAPLWYFLGGLLNVEDSSAVVLMLPLGFSLGTILNVVLHWKGFEKDFGKLPREVGRTLFESFAASVVIGAGIYVGLVVGSALLNTSTLTGILLQAVGAGIFGIATGVLVLMLLGNREIVETWRSVHGKIWGTPVVASDPETM